MFAGLPLAWANAETREFGLHAVQVWHASIA